MAKLTETERKWFEALGSCLRKMPKSVEILVQEEFNGPDYTQSAIHLMKKGVIYTSQEDKDLAAYEPSKHSIAMATFQGVAANNHGY